MYLFRAIFVYVRLVCINQNVSTMAGFRPGVFVQTFSEVSLIFYIDIVIQRLHRN
jgi:hypothetical protein